MHSGLVLHTARSSAHKGAWRVASLLGVVVTAIVLAGSPALAARPGDVPTKPDPCRGNGTKACPDQTTSAAAAAAAAVIPQPQAGPPPAPAPTAATQLPASSPAPTPPAIQDVAAPDPGVVPAPAADALPPEPPAGQQAIAPGASGPVSAAMRSLTPLFVLIAAALVFLAVQGRLDRRDPKLQAAPLDGRGDALPFR